MRRRRDSNDRPWTVAHVRAWLDVFDSSGPIVVLANRQPIRHDRTPDGRIVVRRSASGLVTALEPLVQACSGVWVAHGAGTADRTVVNRRDGLDVPPASLRYRLRRVWLDDDEERGVLLRVCERRAVAPVPSRPCAADLPIG